MGASFSPTDPAILEVRGQRVILDAELARLYGVSTRRFNEAFKRNRSRFPGEFAFRLTPAEFRNLRARGKPGAAQEPETKQNSGNRSQVATGSQKHRDPRYPPWAFTEHGVLMAANLLRSERAIRMSVFVIRAFVQLRERVASNAAILKRLAEIDGILLSHDVALRDIYRKLLPLLEPPPDPPKRRIGFHSG